MTASALQAEHVFYSRGVIQVCMRVFNHSSILPSGDRAHCEVHQHLYGVTDWRVSQRALSAALVCLWTWHAVTVKWASLGSPAKGNESRTMWQAQPGQREPRWGGRQGAKGGVWHACGQHDRATKRLCGTFGRLFLSQILWFEDRSSSVKCMCLTQLSWSQVFLSCCPSWDEKCFQLCGCFFLLH